MTEDKAIRKARRAADGRSQAAPDERSKEIEELAAYFRNGGRLGAVTGPGGIGKSHVCWKVFEQLGIPGIRLNARSQDVWSDLEHFLDRSPGERLVIVDDADMCPAALASRIAAKAGSERGTHFLLSGRALPRDLSSAMVIRLAAMSAVDSARLLERAEVPESQISDITAWARGNPAALLGAAECLLSSGDPLMAWSDVARYLTAIRWAWKPAVASPQQSSQADIDASVIGPVRAAGEELASLIESPANAGLAEGEVHQVATEVFGRYGLEIAPRRIIPVSLVPDDLLRSLAVDPSMARELPPRKFEEVVAELLDRRGYDVELTPQTRDGGYDILARKADDLADLMFLVECKRFAEKRHVGVGLVRSLYGVVQQSRATGGVLVTTSYFTPDAQCFQQAVAHQLQLHDYSDLSRWLHQPGSGGMPFQ